ncbi:MAG: GSCFA domain-containing protein, partial [Bacteroidaceae bacterium]|nr:GSCFA domain-containing protein [Bacteroidaceae bacterium]
MGKASLLLAIDELCRLNEGCHYFPAYEIVLDELRDYRFFEVDMLHPSAVAIDYVWERFRTWAFAPSMHEMHAEWEKLHRAL